MIKNTILNNGTVPVLADKDLGAGLVAGCFFILVLLIMGRLCYQHWQAAREGQQPLIDNANDQEDPVIDIDKKSAAIIAAKKHTFNFAIETMSNSLRGLKEENDRLKAQVNELTGRIVDLETQLEQQGSLGETKENKGQQLKPLCSRNNHATRRPALDAGLKQFFITTPH